MPTHRGERKGKRQRFYARNTLKTTIARRRLAVAFDAFLFGPTGQLSLYGENSPGAVWLCRRRLRFSGTVVRLPHGTGVARHRRHWSLGAPARCNRDRAL